MFRIVGGSLLVVLTVLGDFGVADAGTRIRVRTSALLETPQSQSCASGVLRRRAGRVRSSCAARSSLWLESPSRALAYADRSRVARLRQVPRSAVAYSSEIGLRRIMLRDCGWLSHDQCLSRLDRSDRLQRALGSTGFVDDAEILGDTGYPAVDEVPPIVLVDPPSRFRPSWQGVLPP